MNHNRTYILLCLGLCMLSNMAHAYKPKKVMRGVFKSALSLPILVFGIKKKVQVNKFGLQFFKEKNTLVRRAFCFVVGGSLLYSGICDIQEGVES